MASLFDAWRAWPTMTAPSLTGSDEDQPGSFARGQAARACPKTPLTLKRAYVEARYSINYEIGADDLRDLSDSLEFHHARRGA
jgi:hypothetical protein